MLSNKPHALTTQICDALLARWPFRAIAGHRDGVPLKPAPDAAFDIAARLGVAPAHCAFVGDSAIDIATAQAAGMLPVAVTWGFRPRTELLAAALVADTPAELLAITSSGSRAS